MLTRLFEARPFIIAEVGSSWRTLNDCIQSIGQAKACGADAVKFQAFTHEALYGWPGEKAHFEDRTSWKTPYELPHALPLDWLPALKEKADACGIEFMCTAFSPQLVAAVDPFVGVHKVASSDCTWPQLLQAVAKTGKPVLLSVGASSEGDIRKAIVTLFEASAEPFGWQWLTVLYCVAAYPALAVDLHVMRKLATVVPSIDYGVGFSDHSLGISLAIEASRQHKGLVAIEKHFTAFPDLDSPDRPHSLTPDEFKLMVDYIRGVRQPVIGPTFEEEAMLKRHNRRLIATQDLAAGAQLRYGENFGAYRSLVDDTRGLSPFAWESVEGRTTTKQINRGEALGPGDFG